MSSSYLSPYNAVLTIQRVGRGLLVKCFLRSLRQYWMAEASVAQRTKRARKLQKKLRGIARLLSTKSGSSSPGRGASRLSKAEQRKVADVDSVEHQLECERRQLAALLWLESLPGLRRPSCSKVRLAEDWTHVTPLRSKSRASSRRPSPSSVTDGPSAAARSLISARHRQWCESVLPMTPSALRRTARLPRNGRSNKQPLHCVLCPKNASGELPQWSSPWKLQRHVHCVHGVQLEVVNMCCSACFENTGECYDRVWKLEQHLEHTKCGGCPIAGPSSTAPKIPQFFFAHAHRRTQTLDNLTSASFGTSRNTRTGSDDSLPGAELDDVASIGSASVDVDEFCSGNSSYDDDSHSVASSTDPGNGATHHFDDKASFTMPTTPLRAQGLQGGGSWRDVVAR